MTIIDYDFTVYPKEIQQLPIGLKEAWGAYRFCHHTYGIENAMQANKFLQIHFKRHPIGKEYPADVIQVWRNKLKKLKKYWRYYDTMEVMDRCLKLYSKDFQPKPIGSRNSYSGVEIYKHIFPHEIWQFLGGYRFIHTQLNEDDCFQAPIHYVHLEKIAIKKMMQHHFEKYSHLYNSGTLACWITLINPLKSEHWKSYLVLWLAFQGALIRTIGDHPLFDEKVKITTTAMICLHECTDGYEIYIVSPHELEMLEKEKFINLKIHDVVAVAYDDAENTKLLSEISHRVQEIKKTFKII
jgi:hypothetical protein